jgi:endonuclease III
MTSRVPASPLKKNAATRQLTARADEILTRLKKLNPNPHCELYYETPFQLLLSVVLSAQATDKSVNAAMTDLYKNGLTVDDVLGLGEKGFLEKIRKIGLAPDESEKLGQAVSNYQTKIWRPDTNHARGFGVFAWSWP